MALARFLFLRCLFILFFIFALVNSCFAVDVNKASLTDLMQLKGIGPKTAEQIMTERERGGPYRSMDDLSQRIKGIGPKRLERLQQAGMQITTEVKVANPVEKQGKIQLK